jgi:hypothetical protein
VTQAIELDLFPGTAGGQRAVNGEPFTQDNTLVTVESGREVRYAVWLNGSLQPVVGKRVLRYGRWQVKDLSAIPAMVTEFALPNLADGHNTWSMAMDADGYLHLAGNHHNVPLHYARSANPRDITTWVAPAMVGTQEAQVTYPQFVTCGDGTLLVTYRDGVSGLGNVYLNRYNTATKTWARVGNPLVDAVASGESPYLHYIGVGPDDSIHIAVIWRDGPASSNNDVCHARSLDHGSTWQQMDGTPLTVPLTHAAWAPALNTAPTNSGLLNSCGMAVDDAGHPHIGNELWSSPTDPRTQYAHLYWDGSAWVNEVLTDWLHAMSYGSGLNGVNAELSRPAVACYGGQVYLLYRHNPERGGSLMLRDITPGGDMAEASVLNWPLYGCEFSIAARTVLERGRIEVVVCPSQQEDLPVPALPVNKWSASDYCWANQAGGVLVVDLAAADDVVHARADAPELVLIASAGWGGPAFVTPALGTGQTGLAAFQVEIPGEFAGKRLFARHAGRWNLQAGSCASYTIRMMQGGKILAALSNAADLGAPVEMWSPAALLDPLPADGGWLSLAATVASPSGSPTLRMTTGTIQVYGLRGADGQWL